MKKIAALFLVSVFLIGSMSLCFAQKGQKGASEKAYEHASEEAIFNRVGDWFATVGKSPEEKETIIAERKAKREAKRAEKEARKAQKEAEKEQKRLQKETEKQKQKIKKKYGK